MALQTIAGEGFFYPTPQSHSIALISSTLTIDATGEKAAFCGLVFFAARTGTKTINKVHFRFGAVTKSGGSGLTVSLQNPGTALPMQPDETQDQYRAIGNGEATFASNTWYTSGLVTSDGTDTGVKRTVSFNEPLCVVLEFDGSGRQAPDSIVLSAISSDSNTHAATSALKTGGSWANAAVCPGVILEFSDGTFGTLQQGFPCSALNTHAFKQDTAVADEYALEFQVPWPCKVDGAWVLINPSAATGDFDVVLYDGTTAMTNGTVSVPGEFAAVTSNLRFLAVGFAAEITLTANYTYRLAIKPTQTTQNVSVQSIDVANANHFTCWPGGTACTYTTRLDEGSWAAATATRRLMAGVRISALDDGVGADSTNVFMLTE
jgi:hypothetical protein